MNRFIFHPYLCIGCFACEVACKEEYQLSIGIKWIRVEKMVGEEKPQLSFQLRVCQHCESPPCISACPMAAISQNQDGIIILDMGKCDGCQGCLEACPWGAIAYDPASQKASKCNYCIDRAKPRCVVYCPSGALEIPTTRKT